MVYQKDYYSYIRKGKEWYKFNDCYVTKSSEKEAVEGTFGGIHEYKNKRKIANAYYLVYVKDSEKHLFLDSEVKEVPEEVKLTVENDIYMAQTKEIRLFTSETVKGYWGPGELSVKGQCMKQNPAVVKLENSQTV